MKKNEIICLYCFERFMPDKVHFESKDSNVVINNDNYKCIRSEINENVIVKLIDKDGNILSKRKCPNCSKELYPMAGIYPTFIISVIGAQRVGKSAYLKILIRNMRQKTFSYLGGSCQSTDRETRERISEYFERRIQNQKTEIHEQKPYIFEISFNNTHEDFNLVLFDIPGEAFLPREERFLSNKVPYIKNSNAFIYLFDPLQIDVLKEEIINGLNEKNEELGHIKDIKNRFISTQDVVESIKIAFNELNLFKTIPVAIVLTKSDLLRDSKYIDNDSNIFHNYEHKKYFNLTEFNNISNEVKTFLNDIDSNFFQITKGFGKCEYFAVSCLGYNPTDSSEIDLDDIDPKRVDEPLLWIIAKNKYIKSKYENEQNGLKDILKNINFKK